MPKINFYLDKSEPKNKETFIFLTFHYQRLDGEKIKIKVAMLDTITPELWDFQKQRPKRTNKNKFASDIIQRLNDIENFVLDTYKTDRNIKKDEFIKKIKVAIGKVQEPQKDTPKNDSFLDFLAVFITERESNPEFSKAIIVSYRSLETKLKKFEASKNVKLKFNDITDEFAMKFKSFLFSENLQPSTIKKYFKELKTVMNNSFERGQHTNSHHKRKSFLVKNDVPKSSIFLTVKELNKIKNLNLSDNEPLTIARDWFLVGCYTGLRVSDYLRLNKTHIKDVESTNGEIFQVIDILTQKTKKQVVIPINTPFAEILKKNNNDFPTIRYREQTINEYIKQLGEMAEITESITVTTLQNGKLVETIAKKYEKMSTHVGRRTFITNLRINGAPDNEINKATGHKNKDMINTYDRINLIQNAEKLKSYPFLS